jgi:phage baseplate assembly protein gpV|nr:MAG TPA: puncturing protein [Caudoviricetes sp.]
MQAMAGDECLLLFAGEDKTSPYCLPCSVSAPQSVMLVHGSDSVRVSGGGISVFSQTGRVNVTGGAGVIVSAPRIEFSGNVTVTGNLSVTGSMTNGGKNIGAGHKHSNGTAQDGNTGAVI